MRRLFILSLMISLFSFAACSIKNDTKMDQENKNIQDTPYRIQSGKVIPSDTYGEGDLAVLVTMVGHGSLMFEHGGKIIHVDPYSNVADYEKLPKADLIILTHEHADHLDTIAINSVKKPDTHFIVSRVCNEILGYGDVLSNGDKTNWEFLSLEAVPAYNIVRKRPDGVAYHPKGRGNGYLLTLGNEKIYVAGDTENIPEMDALKGTIDIAFLPKNLPYTMTDDMFIDAAKKVMPKVLYPYHMSEFDQEKIGKVLEGTTIELKVRPMMNK